jgi:hypothetical protein
MRDDREVAEESGVHRFSCQLQLPVASKIEIDLAPASGNCS